MVLALPVSFRPKMQAVAHQLDDHWQWSSVGLRVTLGPGITTAGKQQLVASDICGSCGTVFVVVASLLVWQERE